MCVAISCRWCRRRSWGGRGDTNSAAIGKRVEICDVIRQRRGQVAIARAVDAAVICAIWQSGVRITARTARDPVAGCPAADNSRYI
jgi:hypothetical protein